MKLVASLGFIDVISLALLANLLWMKPMPTHLVPVRVAQVHVRLFRHEEDGGDPSVALDGGFGKALNLAQ